MEIDVVLPYYGDSPHFRAAVRSVLAQRHTDWRLMCVDDASIDGGAGTWLASLDDPRIRSIRNDHNLGVAGNFARCLTLVEAPHFIMMGSDDLMLPSHLSTLAAAADRHPDADMFQSGVEVIDEDGRPTMPLADRVKRILRPRTDHGDVVLEDEQLAVSLTRADWAYFPSILWRSDTAQRIGFDQRFDIALDLGLILDIALDGGRLIVIDPVTFAYRRHRASASMSSARSGERFMQERIFFLEYAERFRRRGWSRAARVAQHHVISRLNAATETPGALLSRDWVAVRSLAAHLFR